MGAKEMKILVGSYNTFMNGPGLALMEMQGEQLKMIAAFAELKDPIWAEQSRKSNVVYVAATQQDGVHACVASYRWEGDSLTLLSRQDDPGRGNCHLCLDEEERFLYSANYSDGSVAVFPVTQDGRILPCLQYFEHQGPLGPRADRQERTHAHQVSFRPGKNELFLCDLGTDQVAVYETAPDGTLTLQQEITCKAGTGPRHLCFDGPDAFYLVGELTGWLSRYVFEGGRWQCVQTLSSLPEGYHGPENTAAAIRVDDGHVYVSNRGHDSIAVFPRKADGMVTKPFFIATPGTFPRDFVLMGSGFLLAQQNSGTVAYMNENGVPGATVKVGGAVSVLPLQDRT